MTDGASPATRREYRPAVPPAPPARLVLWDFDGTLAARDGLWRGALVDALDIASPGHSVTRDMVRAGLRSGRQPTFPWHRSDEPHPDLDTSEAWWRALTPLLTSTYEHAGVEPEIAAEAARLVPAAYIDPRRWTVFPDTEPALRDLRAAGYRNVVLSNHVPELPDLVRSLGLSDLLDDVLTSATTGYEKPNPAMFRLALQREGDPDEAWMVGDNPIADVAGAEAAGIRGLRVRTADGTEPGPGLARAVQEIHGGATDHRPST
jgi:putative hydrolase of the HAD superfamily